MAAVLVGLRWLLRRLWLRPLLLLPWLQCVQRLQHAGRPVCAVRAVPVCVTGVAGGRGAVVSSRAAAVATSTVVGRWLLPRVAVHVVARGSK